MKQSFSAARAVHKPEHSGSALGAVSLLVLSYGLVLGAPLGLRLIEAGLAREGGALGPRWVPMLAAAGLGLLGAAALVGVMLKVVRDLEQHPYASLSAALGVLLGVMLMGLKASLHVGALGPNSLAFLCITISVLGGGLVQAGPGLTIALGILITTLPCQLVVIALWSQSGFEPDLVGVLRELSTPDRTYLVLLAGSGVLLSVVAVLARNLIPLALRQAHLEQASLASAGQERESVTTQQLRVERALALALADRERAELPPTPANFSVWGFHDKRAPSHSDELPELPLRSNGALLWSLLSAAALVAVVVASWLAR